VSDQVDASVQLVETATGQPVIDASVGQTCGEKLTSRDDSVLPGRELCDRWIRCSAYRQTAPPRVPRTSGWGLHW
jgi:hypothetical protein